MQIGLYCYWEDADGGWRLRKAKEVKRLKRSMGIMAKEVGTVKGRCVLGQCSWL